MDRLEAATILGITPDASAEQAKTAWKMKARQSHPDLGGSPRMFDLFTEAKEVFEGFHRDRIIHDGSAPQRNDCAEPEKSEPAWHDEDLTIDDAPLVDEDIDEYAQSHTVDPVSRLASRTVTLAWQRRDHLITSLAVALGVFALCLKWAINGRSIDGLAASVLGDSFAELSTGVWLLVPVAAFTCFGAVVIGLGLGWFVKWPLVQMLATATLVCAWMAAVFGWPWGYVPVALCLAAPVAYLFLIGKWRL